MKLLKLFTAIGIFSVVAFADVDVNVTNFPDDNFRAYVSGLVSGRSVITNAEIAAVTIIDVSGKSISNLKGIELFTALVELNCSDNRLTSLDLSNNLDLEVLEASSSELTSINITQNSKLKTLFCSGNRLTYLDLSNKPVLTRTGMNYQQPIVFLQKDGDNWSADVLLNNPSLPDEFYYLDGKLISTDKNITATVLHVETGYDGPGFTDNPPLPRLGFGGTMNLVYLVDGDIAISKENFPDDNFREWLWNKFPDGKITPDDIDQTTSIVVSTKDIKNLKGIEFFTALELLNCNSNPLTYLDLSGNTALKELYCNNSQLDSINLSENIDMIGLYVAYNNLTTLDVSNNQKLATLYCFGNHLVNVDLTENLLLTNFKGDDQTRTIKLLGAADYYSAIIELRNPQFSATQITYADGKIISSDNNIPLTLFMAETGVIGKKLEGTLNFVYAAPDSFSVVFMIEGDNENDVEDDIYITINVENGETISQPTAPEIPEWIYLYYGDVCGGWKFFEWSKERRYEDYGIDYAGEELFNFETPITEDLILYAKWVMGGLPIKPTKPDSKYGIKFAKNIVNDKAEINVVLPENDKAAETKVVVYDAIGNIVFTTNSRGSEKITWDLKNSSGRFVANGSFLVIAEVKGINGMNYAYSAKLGVKR